MTHSWSPQNSLPAGVLIAACVLACTFAPSVGAGSDPVLTLDPTALKAGDRLTIAITGADPNKSVQLYWTNSQGAYQFSSADISRTDALGNARFSLTLATDLRPSNLYKMRAKVGSQQWTTEAALEILPTPGPGTWIEAGQGISRTFKEEDPELYAHLGASVFVSGIEEPAYKVLWKVISRDRITCGADNCGVVFEDKTAQKTKVTFPAIGIKQGLYTLEVCALYLGCDRLEAAIKQGGRSECDEARRDAYLEQFCPASFIEALQSGSYSWPSIGGVGVNSWGPYHACNIGNLPVGGITAGGCRGKYAWPLGNEQTTSGRPSAPSYNEGTKADAYAAIVAEAWNPNFMRAARLNGVNFSSGDMNLSGRYLGQVMGITGPYKWLGIDPDKSDFMPVDYAYTYVSPDELRNGPGALPSCMQDGSQDAQLYGMYKDWWGLCHDGRDNPDCSSPGRKIPETGKCVPDWRTVQGRSWRPGVDPAAQYTGGPLPFRYLGCNGDGGVKTNADEVACGPVATHVCMPDKSRANLNDEVTFTAQRDITPIEWLGELPDRSSYDVVPPRQDRQQSYKVRFTQLAGNRTVGLKHYVGSQRILDLCGSVIIDSPDTEPGCTSVTLNRSTSSYSPAQTTPGGSIAVKCDFGRAVNYITSQISGGSCNFTGWTDTTVANFTCTAPGSAGTYPVACKVNTSTDSVGALCPITETLGDLTVRSSDPVGQPACTIEGQASSSITKPLGEEFDIRWASTQADSLDASGWSGPIDCGKGQIDGDDREAYDTHPYKCRDKWLREGDPGLSSTWGKLYMREAGTASVTLTPKRADGTTGPACSISITAQSAGSGDTTAPNISITSPISGATYATSSTPLLLAGSMSDNVGVTSITWSNNRGPSGSARLIDRVTWDNATIPLVSGANVITVTARDAAGNEASDTLTVTYTSSSTSCANDWNSTSGGNYDKDGTGTTCACDYWDACGNPAFGPVDIEHCSPNPSHAGNGCTADPEDPRPGGGGDPGSCAPPLTAPGGWTPLISAPTGNNIGVEAFGTVRGPQPGETAYYKIPIDRDLEGLRVRFNELQEPFEAAFRWRFYRGRSVLGSSDTYAGTTLSLSRDGRDIGVQGSPTQGNYYLEITNTGSSLHGFFLGWTPVPAIDRPAEPAVCQGDGPSQIGIGSCVAITSTDVNVWNKPPLHEGSRLVGRVSSGAKGWVNTAPPTNPDHDEEVVDSIPHTRTWWNIDFPGSSVHGYVRQMFLALSSGCAARVPLAGTVTIQGGAATTTTRQVTLTLSANSATVTHMQLSNNGTTYSDPEAFALTKPWTLSEVEGLKTVYAKFKNNSDQWSAAASDTITFQLPRHRLAVTKTGAGSGAVTRNPAGTSCGTDCAEHLAGAHVTLTAVPAAGSVFSGWSGPCTGTGDCLLTMDAPKTLTATFTLATQDTGNGGEELPPAPRSENSGARALDGVEFSAPHQEKSYSATFESALQWIKIYAVDANSSVAAPAYLHLTVISPSGNTYKAQGFGTVKITARKARDMITGKWQITLKNGDLVPGQRVRLIVLPKKKP